MILRWVLKFWHRQAMCSSARNQPLSRSKTNNETEITSRTKPIAQIYTPFPLDEGNPARSPDGANYRSRFEVRKVLSNSKDRPSPATKVQVPSDKKTCTKFGGNRGLLILCIARERWIPEFRNRGLRSEQVSPRSKPVNLGRYDIIRHLSWHVNSGNGTNVLCFGWLGPTQMEQNNYF